MAEPRQLLQARPTLTERPITGAQYRAIGPVLSATSLEAVLAGRRPCSPAVAQAIADALGQPVAELFEEAPLAT